MSGLLLGLWVSVMDLFWVCNVLVSLWVWVDLFELFMFLKLMNIGVVSWWWFELCVCSGVLWCFVVVL